MKSAIVVFALCFAVALGHLTDEQKAKLGAYMKSCAEETGIDQDAVKNAMKGAIPESEEKVGCLIACMMKKIGILNPDGTINEEVTRSKLPAAVPQDKADEVLNKCKSLSGTNVCQTGIKLINCFMEYKSLEGLSILQ